MIWDDVIWWKGHRLEKRKTKHYTNLFYDLSKSFNFSESSEKWGYYQRILMINKWHKMYILKRFEKLYKCKKLCDYIYRQHVDSFVCFLTGIYLRWFPMVVFFPFLRPLSTQERYREKKRNECFLKEMLGMWWKFFNLWILKQIPKTSFISLVLSPRYLNKWRANDF